MSRVLVLGNAGVDLVLSLPRLPRPGETLTAAAMTRAPGGKGLNQAVVAARAGLETRFMAAIGDDADGRLIAETLGRERFAALLLIPRPPPTDLSIVMVAADAENSIVSTGACADALDPAMAAAFATSASPGDVLLLQGNLTEATTRAALLAGTGRDAFILLNAAPLRWDVPPMLAHCTAVVANQGEAAAITGIADPARAAAALRAAGPRLAVATLGAAGCVYADETGTNAVPALTVAALDSTAAGDAFCGMLAACIARRWSFARGIVAAQQAAAITVGRPGAFAALPLVTELPRL